MKQNLGAVDRVLRFVLAFWWLGPFAPRFGAEFVWLNWIVIALGLITLLESFTGYCWLHKLLGLKAH